MGHRSGRFRKTIVLRQSPGGALLHAVLHSPRLGTTPDADAVDCLLPVICCLNVVLDGWGATTFGGLVGARSALAAARASLGPNPVFSVDRSHSRVFKKKIAHTPGGTKCVLRECSPRRVVRHPLAMLKQALEDELTQFNKGLSKRMRS